MGKTIKLISGDGEMFEVEEAVAFQSNIIKSLADEDNADDCIPLPRVDSQILSKVLEFCRKHANSPSVHTKFAAIPSELCPKHDGSAAGASSSESSSAHSETCRACYDAVMKLVQWDLEFVKVDLDLIHHLLKAANYLDIEDLMFMAVEGAANAIRGNNPEEIRKLFDLENDFTPEEEKEILKEYSWLDDPFEP
ncbi:SKP1-like protein 1 [Zingiber officinale]|nr:SKP1-like protein 1 [Zingiber officinale]